jgi:hypothetical protein
MKSRCERLGTETEVRKMPTQYKIERPNVEIILPEGRAWRRPRCQATVSDQTAMFRERVGMDDLCQRHAVYRVNGEQLCKLHAGDKAISLLLIRQLSR